MSAFDALITKWLKLGAAPDSMIDDMQDQISDLRVLAAAAVPDSLENRRD